MLRSTLARCQGKYLSDGLTGVNKQKTYALFFKYPQFENETSKDQGSFQVVKERFELSIKNHKSRSPGILPKIRGPLVQLARGSELKGGELVGEDEYGNRYYENNDYTLGRNRWVVFADRSFHETWNWDSSQMPAEWHRWMTQMTSKRPSEITPTKRVFALEHKPMGTGIPAKQYFPYSTTRYKIDSWDHTQA